MSQFEIIDAVRASANKRLPNPMHLPWHAARLLDRRTLRRKLNIRRVIGASSALQLERYLVNRAGDARDLFALRGVRTRRSTVLQLMSRSVAADLAAANDNGAFIDGLEALRDEAALAPASLVAALR